MRAPSRSDRVGGAFGDVREMLDDDGAGLPAGRALSVPRCRKPSVDQHGALHLGCAPGFATSFVGHEPGPVGVRQERVVVLGEEAHRCLDVAGRPRRIGQIEELPAALVTEAAQLWAQPFDDFAKACQVRPRGDVGDGRGTKGLEISQHDVVDAGRGGELDARPNVRAVSSRPDPNDPTARVAGPAPAPAGSGTCRPGQLRSGRESARRARRAAACPFGVAPRAGRVRTRAPRRCRRRRAEARSRRCRANSRFEHRLHQRSELQCVIDGEEMQGRAHRGDANE